MVSKAATMNDAITISGGAYKLRGKVNFIRINNDGSIDSRLVKYKQNAKRGSFNKPYLQENDLIFVRGNLITGTSEVLGGITEPFRAILETYGIYKIITD